MINIRCLRFTSCLVCDRDLSQARHDSPLDETDEDGRHVGAWFQYRLPPARFRDRMAPDICDVCWGKHRQEMLRMNTGRGRYVPPFRQIYFWAWVAAELDKRARQLVPHLKTKAERGVAALMLRCAHDRRPSPRPRHRVAGRPAAALRVRGQAGLPERDRRPSSGPETHGRPFQRLPLRALRAVASVATREVGRTGLMRTGFYSGLVKIEPATKETIIARLKREADIADHDAANCRSQAYQCEIEAESLRVNAGQLDQSASALREVIDELEARS